MITIKTSEAEVLIEPLANSMYQFHLKDLTSEIDIKERSFKSVYGEKVARALLDMGGVKRLLSELKREEGPTGLENSLRYYILSFLPDEKFLGKRLLDFGCGCGASTVALSRILPETSIIGLDRLEDCIKVCNLKKEQLGLDNLSFIASHRDDKLPDELGTFEYCMLCGVYEHLLPNERRTLLHEIWSKLSSGGILFISQTPNRYSPIGTHVTRIPMVNFLPDSLAFYIGQWAMRRDYGEEATWERLLRGGFRGGSAHEIEKILQETGISPQFMEPTRLGVKDPIDIWNMTKDSSNLGLLKQFAGYFCKGFKSITGITIAPYINLAIQKGPSNEQG